MFPVSACFSANGVHVLLHDISFVIPAVFMFMGCRQLAPDMSSFCEELFILLQYEHQSVQHGHFDALMTIDLGAICLAVDLLVAIKFFYLQT